MRTAPIEWLHEALEYVAESGVLVWKERPASHFASERAMRSFNSKYAHKEAGCVFKSTGYRIVNLGANNLIGTHRIVFAMMHGYWPEMVDHINGCKLDNRFENLRACIKEENCRNRRRNASTRSGLKGVSKSPSGDRWQARIQVDHKQVHLGMFDTPEMAHYAYRLAAAELHGSFANAG